MCTVLSERQGPDRSPDRAGGAAEPLRQLRGPEPLRESPVLLFAPVKRTQTEFIVQKATEMGAVRLQPVITDRTNREKLRLDRLTAIATEAAEQSGTALFALAALYALLPCVIKLLSIWLLRGYPIDAAEQERIKRRLADGGAGETAPSDSAPLSQPAGVH